MTEPIRNHANLQTQTTKQAKSSKKQQENSTSLFEKNEPSTAKLAVNRAGAVIMTPLVGVAGALTVTGAFWYRVFNPDVSVDDAVKGGLQAAGQGSETLEKMWNGKFF